MKLPGNNLYYRALFSYAIVTICWLDFPDSNAAEWDIKPRIAVRETYTDNVRLGGGFLGGLGGGGGGKQGGDFITQINPGLSVSGNSRRWDLKASYTMNNLIFAENSNFSRIRHRLRARGTSELVKDLFFVDGRAAIFQQNAFLFGPQAIDNTNVGNRVNVNIYSVSPYLRHRFQNFASTELRYRHGIVETGSNGLRNSQSDSFRANLASGDAFRILSWGLNYSHQQIHIDGSRLGNRIRPARTIELERSIGNLRYNITPRFGLTAMGGYERNSFISIKGKPSSPIWRIGFAWAPSKRTDIRASAGQRFFGDTYAAKINHRTRLTTWDASYTENVTTFNQGALGGAFVNANAFQFVDPTSGFLTGSNSLTNRVFLQRRAQATVTINGARNSLALRVFNLSRKALTSAEDDIDLLGPANASLFNNTKQTGGTAFLTHRMSPRTSANINVSFFRVDFVSGNRTDNNAVLLANLTRRFESNLRGMLQYRRIERISNQAEGISANSVTASINMDF